MKHPHCERCGAEFNKYEDSEKAYRTPEGLLCKECTESYIEERVSFDELAEALGLVVVSV